jgi:hypothetical protein
VKGRPMPILIFELIGHHGDAGERPASVADFERGLIAYPERHVLEAYEIFSICATDYTGSGGRAVPAVLPALPRPPAPNAWDGVCTS